MFREPYASELHAFGELIARKAPDLGLAPLAALAAVRATFAEVHADTADLLAAFPSVRLTPELLDDVRDEMRAQFRAVLTLAIARAESAARQRGEPDA